MNTKTEADSLNHLLLALGVFVCVFGSAWLGLYVRERLPAHHLSDESIGVVKLATGLIAPRNGTIIVALLMCALSTSGAIYLIEELSRPLDGWVGVSVAPMRDTLSRMGQ
ncbi:hypothetical protein QN386_08230 [Pseudomonas sp. CCI3.2]|uniref:hypothetical protein n=1 Tax=unclassified Pseudomonas TaxID=196821 RepID=UPI002AC8F6CF|nr:MULTISPECIES: hypothetical protein [unclassified Pseudomonas]MEB0077700.1 hypothetical protein [Pseudomonas sp. MH10out]MEB0090880.1 hypothetical protein [Pseudomonas sp. CCI4.2]MEB0101306.1 hypothetical protein [Pseudomonas sp. CCI3.2]MEB0131413.1 hypothetical protein [Pseudomonas sp. CCI2.4]MEB0158423.1 hypothetical protein [Pseudomonas sp. AH2 (2023)]